MDDLNQPAMPLGPMKTPLDLRKLMLRNNTKHGKRFHYFDFIHVPGQGWFCWFEIKEADRVTNESK